MKSNRQRKPKRKVSTLIERRRTAAARAMPEVKRLIKKHGRAAVGNCLAKIRDVEKQATKIATMQREIAVLRRKLK